MPDAFFSSTRKRKHTAPSSTTKATHSTGPKRQRSQPNVKKINKKSKQDSDDEDDNEPSNIDDMNLMASEEDSSEEEIEETAAEKRVRLAKAYLNKIQDSLEDDLDGFDAADLDRDLIADRLKKDADEIAGKLHRRVADLYDYEAIDESSIKTCRGHQLAVTAVALSENGSIIYTGSKDGSIIKWDVKTMKKLHTFPGGRKGVKDFVGHTDHVLALAISSDGQYLASGGKDKVLNIWSVKDNQRISSFTHHKDAVSGLAFRKGSNQLYSASHDRTIKLWNIDERTYIETLFGHQDQITSIDTLGRERCMTTGGRDKTARLWKIVEESQLVYRGGVTTKYTDGEEVRSFTEGSIDCLAQLDEDMFVTGGDSGTLSLWDINRKKPTFSFAAAHGLKVAESESEGDIKTPYWITALASLRYSDLLVSGSWDGFVRVWKLSKDNKNITQVGQIPVKGVVNSIQIKTVFPSNRTLLVIGVGQELRLGRWVRLKGVKNCTKVIELPTFKTTAQKPTEEH